MGVWGTAGSLDSSVTKAKKRREFTFNWRKMTADSRCCAVKKKKTIPSPLQVEADEPLHHEWPYHSKGQTGRRNIKRPPGWFLKILEMIKLDTNIHIHIYIF